MGTVFLSAAFDISLCTKLELSRRKYNSTSVSAFKEVSSCVALLEKPRVTRKGY